MSKFHKINMLVVFFLPRIYITHIAVNIELYIVCILRSIVCCEYLTGVIINGPQSHKHKLKNIFSFGVNFLHIDFE